MKKNRVKVFRGRGTVLGPGRVQVEGPGAAGLEGGLLEARHVVVAVGSEPVELPFLPFDGERVVDSTAALAFPEVPRRLVVVGGGAVGLELATVWRRLGSEVAVVEMLPQVAPFADRYAARLLSRALAAQGIELHVNSRVVGLDEAPAGSELPLLLRVQGPKGEELSLACDRVLVAVGRRARVGAAGLAELGVELERGRVRVDERFQTSVPGVYALGDLVRGPMLAHKAEEEGIALAELLAGREARVDYAAIPSVVYTEPELAQVGLTEEQLKERGIPFRAGRFYFAANARARSMERTAGAIKVLAEPGSGRLLGVHLVGPHVSELLAEAVFAYAHGARAQDLAETVHAHPTLSEALREAALAVERRAIHG